MYDNFQVLWDKSGSPYMPQSSFDIYANNKYNDFVEMMGRVIETEERFMADIQYLFTTFSKANSNIIDRVADVPDFRRRMRMNATFTNPCSAKLPPLLRNVRPVPNSQIDIMQNDPNNKGIDEDPLAIATQLPTGDPGWQLFSDTVPLIFSMTYIKVPQVIDSANNPNTIFEAPDYIANYIIRLVLTDGDTTIENYERSKLESAAIKEVLA